MLSKKHKILAACCVLVMIVVAYMAFTNTLAYPYIILDRQVQSLKDCTFGSTHFTTDFYRFSFSSPEGYCVLPNRLFPEDGSIEIVPKGWYFVLNEYAQGTVAEASRATLLFEPVTVERDPEKIIQTLVNGKFLDMSNVSIKTASSGIEFVLANSTRGTDDELYDWAFATHPDKNNFVAIVARHSTDQVVRDYLLETLNFR